jgi:hypothetical protein
MLRFLKRAISGTGSKKTAWRVEGKGGVGVMSAAELLSVRYKCPQKMLSLRSRKPPFANDVVSTTEDEAFLSESGKSSRSWCCLRLGLRPKDE